MTNPAAPTPSPVPPASGGGMPKWLIIVLVVGLVVVLGCCGGLGSCWMVARRGARQVRSEWAAQTQQMARGGGGAAGGGIVVAGGGMPANFPGDVPVMAGFTSAGVSISDTVKGTGMVMLNGRGTRAAVVTYYEKQMKDQGWSEANNVEIVGSATLIFNKDTRQATIQATETNGAVVLMIQYGPKP